MKILEESKGEGFDSTRESIIHRIGRAFRIIIIEIWQMIGRIGEVLKPISGAGDLRSCL